MVQRSVGLSLHCISTCFSAIRRRMELKSGFGGSLEPLFLEEWLLSLRPGAKTREERSCLVEKCARGARQRSARLCLASVLDE